MVPGAVPQIRGRRLLIAIIATATMAITFYWHREPSCAHDPRGMRGEMMRGPDGAILYFDGQCWSHTPVPPMDTAL